MIFELYLRERERNSEFTQSLVSVLVYKWASLFFLPGLMQNQRSQALFWLLG